MEELEIDGLVVRETPAGEADKLITLLTAERGRILVSGKGVSSLRSKYAASAQMFMYECDKYGCDVVLGVHPHRMDLFEKLEQRVEGGPNVFIVGREGVRANLHVRGQEALDVAQKALDEM